MRVLILLALLGAAVEPVLKWRRTALESSDTVPKNGHRIVGGTPTTVESYPFMSNMQYGWLGIVWSQFCGGTLVTSNMVLTAAHCLLFVRPSHWRVRLGTTFATSVGTEYNVQQVLLHPQYDETTLDSDIAIMRLATRATFSDSVGVASIAGPNYNLPDGTVVSAAGWGALYDGGPLPDQLHHVDMNIISQSYCAKQYAWLKTQPDFEDWQDVTDNMLCAGIQYVGGKDACPGDSGGPLVHNGNVLVGITSWGYSCGHPDFPGVNVRVSRYTDWIVSNA